jgi:tetratricopeptide (TPR) repeat protein
MSNPEQTHPDAPRMLQEIEAALQDRDLERAAGLAEAALAQGVEHPLILNLSALRLEEQGRLEEAFERLRRALELAPSDVFVLSAIGLNLDRQGRRDQALRAFEAALSIDPGFPQAHHNRAQTLQALGDFDGARQGYEQAASLSAIYADPLGGLATLDVRQGDMAAARTHAERALAIEPAHAVARVALANAELSEGATQDAERRLRGLLDDPALTAMDRPAVACLLGDTLDRQGRTWEAFEAYSTGKALTERLYEPQFGPRPGRPTALEQAQMLRDFIAGADAEAWSKTDLSDKGDAAQHVFLLGFPRSGTTLLEQVLASHPQVATLDERTAMVDAEVEFLSSRDGLERLSRIEGEELKLFRDAYWGRIKAFGLDVRGKVFIDKFPLATMKLPLIAKLFPHARILFALRDPRAVALSCFRRGFGMNPSMYQFVTLDGTARFYDAVMGLGEVCRARLPLTVQEVRYETLVEDFDGTARAVADFIGLEWSDALRDFARTAEKRAIRTPSASQVRQGLYSDALQQWRLYQDQLTPILPILQPWVEKWGYPPD